MLDVLYAVRSDESTHRFVNHSLANLDYKSDINPFALREPDMHVKGTKLGCAVQSFSVLPRILMPLSVVSSGRNPSSTSRSRTSSWAGTKFETTHWIFSLDIFITIIHIVQIPYSTVI